MRRPTVPVGPLEYGAGFNDYYTRGVQAAAASPADFEPDSDHDFSATLNLRAHAGDVLSIDVRGFYNESRTDIPGYPPPDYTLQASPEYLRDYLRAGYVGLNGSWLGGRITQRLALIGTTSDRRQYGNYDSTTYAFIPGESFYYQGDATRLRIPGDI